MSSTLLKETLITRWLSSFRGKLYAGFSSIGLLTLFITGFALYLFNQFGEIVNTTAGEAIPELMAVMRLSANSALLAAGAPVLAASQTELELSQTETRLNRLAQEINSNMDQLSGSGMAFDAIKQHSAKITATLTELKEATLKRLVLQEKRYTGLEVLRAVQGDLVDTLSPVVYGASSLSNLFARRGGRLNATAVKNMMEERVSLLFALLEIEANTYRIASLLGSSFDLPSEQWQEQCRLATANMVSHIPRLESVDVNFDMREIPALVKVLTTADPCNTNLHKKNSTEHLNFTAIIQRLAELLAVLVPEHRSIVEVDYQKTIRQVKSSPVELANVTIRNLRFALEIKAEGNLLIGLLTAVTDADEQQTIVNLFTRYRTSLETFRNAVKVFQNSDLAKRNPILAGHISTLERQLAAFGSGSTTLFATRKDELSVSEQIGELLATHREEATSLTAQANTLVSKVQTNVFDLRDAMEHRLVTAISILVVVCIGSLLIAASIAYITTLLLSRHESDLQAANRAAELLNHELETFNYLYHTIFEHLCDH